MRLVLDKLDAQGRCGDGEGSDDGNHFRGGWSGLEHGEHGDAAGAAGPSSHASPPGPIPRCGRTAWSGVRWRGRAGRSSSTFAGSVDGEVHEGILRRDLRGLDDAARCGDWT